MTTRQKAASSNSYVTIIRDPKDSNKNYQLPIDVAEVLYQSGKLESFWKDEKKHYCTPFVDDPEIGLYRVVDSN